MGAAKQEFHDTYEKELKEEYKKGWNGALEELAGKINEFDNLKSADDVLRAISSMVISDKKEIKS